MSTVTEHRIGADPNLQLSERETLERLAAGRAQIEAELSKVIVGQKEVIEQILLALFAGGHCLITGAPGLAKTLLVRSIAQIFQLKFQRIQFTPDLMPADITGTEILQVTAAGVRYPLEEPFFVLATQNPIEMEGTYPLPEAQLDRFMFNVVIDYLPENDEVAVVTQTTSRPNAPIEALFSGEDILNFHEIVRKVPIAEDLVRYAVRLAAASRPHREGAPDFV